MIFVCHASRVLAAQDLFYASLNGLESLPIAARGKRIALVAVRFNGIGIPVSRAHTFNEICTDPITLDRQRVIRISDVDRIDFLKIRSDILGYTRRNRERLEDRNALFSPHHSQAVNVGGSFSRCDSSDRLILEWIVLVAGKTRRSHRLDN